MPVGALTSRVAGRRRADRRPAPSTSVGHVAVAQRVQLQHGRAAAGRPATGGRSSSPGAAEQHHEHAERRGAEQVVDELAAAPRRRAARRRRTRRRGRRPPPTRSRNAVHAANRSSRAKVARRRRRRAAPRAGAAATPAPRRRRERPARPARSASSRRVGRTAVAGRVAGLDAGGPSRPRTASASAQNATPSPYDRHRPVCQRDHGLAAPSMYFSNSQASRDLPTPGVTVDDHQPRPAAVLGAVEQLLDQPQLAVAPDQRRLQPVGPLQRRRPRRRPRAPTTAAPARPCPSARARRRRRSVIAAAVSSRVVSSTHTWPGCGGGLDPRRGVHRRRRRPCPAAVAPTVTATSPVTIADPHRQPGRADVLAERRDRGDQLEPGAHRPLGVVLVRGRHAPHRHHRVADELLDRRRRTGRRPAGTRSK